MTKAQEILKMIETVDPNDTAKLDEIDARVWCYLGGDHWGKVEPVKFISFGTYHFEGDERPTGSVLTFSFMGKYPHETEYRDCIVRMTLSTKYTRSRDALKQIRPEGWTFEMSQVNDGGDWGCELTNLSDNKIVGYFHGTCESFKTEELAELYAIIQSLEWERKNEK